MKRVLLMLLLAFTSVILASDVLGNVTVVEGKVFKKVNGEWKLVKLHDPVKLNDIFKVGKNSMLEVRYNNGSVFKIAENSLLKFYLNRIYLKKGNILLTVFKTAKGFEVKTPTMVAAVKGTTFIVKQRKEKAVGVLRGLVAVTNGKNSKLVKQNEAVIAKGRKLYKTKLRKSIYSDFVGWRQRIIDKAYGRYLRLLKNGVNINNMSEEEKEKFIQERNKDPKVKAALEKYEYYKMLYQQ